MVPSCEKWPSRPGGTAISACWWQRPQTPLNSSVSELAARPCGTLFFGPAALPDGGNGQRPSWRSASISVSDLS